LNPDTLYENAPNWNDFLMIRLRLSMAYIKRRTAESSKGGQVSFSISLDARGARVKLQKLELVLSWAALHFVGWVESTPSFVGFLRLRRTNLHFAGVIAKYETQQRPISKLAVFFWPAAGLI
jgi:hypothetical protein